MTTYHKLKLNQKILFAVTRGCEGVTRLNLETKEKDHVFNFSFQKTDVITEKEYADALYSVCSPKPQLYFASKKDLIAGLLKEIERLGNEVTDLWTYGRTYGNGYRQALEDLEKFISNLEEPTKQIEL